jgi:hypothetical protein
MNREVLERPFGTNQIKTRRGRTGKPFSYVEGAEYVRRLNDAFDGEWSFEIVEHHVHRREVVVVGRLVAAGCTKMAFGGASVTMSGQSGEPVSLADDLKAAATDALKKAASLFGVGLHLYVAATGESGDTSAVDTTAVPVSAVPRSGSRGSEKRPVEVPLAATPSALTERQLNAITAIGRNLGWTSEMLRQRAIDAFGAPPHELTRADASTFIDELKQEATKAA